MRRIQNKKHKLRTYEIDKISLSCFDGKRFVLDDEIHTWAYSYKNGVRNCKKKFKKIVITENDCDN